MTSIISKQLPSLKKNHPIATTTWIWRCKVTPPTHPQGDIRVQLENEQEEGLVEKEGPSRERRKSEVEKPDQPHTLIIF